MTSLKLIVGNRNYSSWSMRAGLAARHSGLACTEVLIPLDRPETRGLLAEHSPSGLVPVLNMGSVDVWDSLAIVETFAELAPDTHFWPEDPAARAVARSVSAEMHSGFYRLRRDMPMDLRSDYAGQRHTEGALADAARIQALWAQCRKTYGEDGPFLFGAWSAADMMYAPVVGRFRSYAVPLDDVSRAYVEAVWAQPDVATWVAEAIDEPYVVDVHANA